MGGNERGVGGGGLDAVDAVVVVGRAREKVLRRRAINTAHVIH